jgi:hypothetical protein
MLLYACDDEEEINTLKMEFFLEKLLIIVNFE